MTCAEQFRLMAFAQLTWRESMRDIEVTLGDCFRRAFDIAVIAPPWRRQMRLAIGVSVPTSNGFAQGALGSAEERVQITVAAIFSSNLFACSV